MPQNTCDDNSTLVQVIASYHQAKAITRTSVDPDLSCHMMSPGRNVLMQTRCNSSALAMELFFGTKPLK